jgi:hypothetical protein
MEKCKFRNTDINMDIEMASMCQMLASQITRKLCNM